jgi:hypothetical protein
MHILRNFTPNPFGTGKLEMGDSLIINFVTALPTSSIQSNIICLTVPPLLKTNRHPDVEWKRFNDTGWLLACP